MKPPGGIDRRELLRGALASGALLAAGCATARPRPRERRPSVLFLAIDDLNDWTGFLGGYPGLVTPHLDALAAAGRPFTHAYSSASACNPSRSSLLTGLAPWTLGLYDNRISLQEVAPGIATLPEVFAAAGYATIGGGKIFHGSFPDAAAWGESFPPPHETTPAGRPLNGLLPPDAFAGLPGLDRLFDWGPFDVAASETADGQLAAWAEGVLARGHAGSRHGDRPLFLGVGFGKPHLPWYVPRADFDLFPLAEIRLPEVRPDDLDDVGPLARAWVAGERVWPQLVTEPAVARQAVQAYLAAVRFVDEQVGRVLAAWQRSPHAAGGVIVLWSDHGFHLGQKLHWRKSTLWEEATRVPLVVVAPEVERPGEACERPASLLDLFPTLVELCRLPPRPKLEGTSLVPWLRDPAAPRAAPAVTAWSIGSAAVRNERYRYIRYADGFTELYDHAVDPHEWSNRAGQRELSGVEEELARWLPRDWRDARREPAEPRNERD